MNPSINSSQKQNKKKQPPRLTRKIQPQWQAKEIGILSVLFPRGCCLRRADAKAARAPGMARLGAVTCRANGGCDVNALRTHAR